MKFRIFLGDYPLVDFTDRFEAYEALFKWKELDQTAKLGLVSLSNGEVTEWLV